MALPLLLTLLALLVAHSLYRRGLEAMARLVEVFAGGPYGGPAHVEEEAPVRASGRRRAHAPQPSPAE